ncbi:DNA translocase FtsK [Streptococcus sp. DD13]|uniref:DNA translocase FtsK n=1 Tax=Streptococcus sp. DD13 TaxID=1777881 RepID=UPI000833CCD6|nr:DNA translocase FtsK [Streptococcus sp. DD13]
MSNKTQKKRPTRRPTKAELARKEKIRHLWMRLGVVFLLLFALSKVGIFGITVYNLVRFFVGSTANLLIVAVIIGLLFQRRIARYEGMVSGFILFYAGLLIWFQATLAASYTASSLFSQTLSLSLRELSNFQIVEFLGGGLIGATIYLPIAFLFARIGSFFISILLIGFGLFFMSPWTIYDLVDRTSELYERFQEKRLQRQEQREIKRQQEREQAEKMAAEESAQASKPSDREEDFEQYLAQTDQGVDLETGELYDLPPLSETDQEQEVPIFSAQSGDFVEDDFSILLAEEERPHTAVAPGSEEDGDVEIDFTPKQQKAYHLPSIDLFPPMKVKSQENEKRLVRQNIKVLEETFQSFGIKVTVERAEIGPSVTKYEVKPAVGVRVNRISNLADDLALALAAKDVRIEAPIPGKSLVGIEVPNSEIATVSFRELWEASQTDAKKLLEVPLGKAVNGTARSFNLARMPHLLVAGSTGSGKSVAVNGIIASILMKASPDQVKFMMIDPKMVELSVYNDIPHLLIPVVTNPRKAARALQKVVDEMEKRYELFSKVGVRNLEGYNAKVAQQNAQSDMKEVPMPLIVVIVDELADLMMVASKEVEDAIIRLGQKARAAGIHMILATQRPSVDVISGLIKANVPSRIAFAVSSGTDSRTILDENGAEKLLGRGDMLFKPIDENHPIRLQGSFISDDDVESIVAFIKGQAEADYDESFDPGEVSEGDTDNGLGSASASEGDPLFQEAKALVIETQKASASMIQRRLSVGFNRATRLMEELEVAGVIGPAEGTKPRKVLANTTPSPIDE